MIHRSQLFLVHFPGPGQSIKCIERRQPPPRAGLNLELRLAEALIIGRLDA